MRDGQRVEIDLPRADTRREEFLEPTVIPSGDGSVRHMVFSAADQALWFGCDSNTLARARLPFRRRGTQ